MEKFLIDHWMDILGTLTGLIYVYQEYKASIYLWITGIIMPVIYIFVYYEAGLFADFGMSYSTYHHCILRTLGRNLPYPHSFHQ